MKLSLPVTSIIANDLDHSSIFKAPIVIIQHLLPDTIEFLKILQKQGWNILKIFVIPNSANTDAIEAAKKMGIELIVCDVLTNNLLVNHLSEVLVKHDKVILHEVGGYFAKILAEYPDIASRVIGVVEETKRGLWQYMTYENQLSIPVIQIADNPLKKIEADFVGKAVLKSISNYFNKNTRIGLIGLGDIGMGVARACLSKGVALSGFDIDPSKILAAAAQGINCKDLISIIKSSEIIIGATGHGAFEIKHLNSLSSETILVSASSRQVEFPINHIMKHFENKVSLADNMISYTFGAKKIRVLNNGYPANFLVGSLPISLADLMFAQIATSLNLLNKNDLKPGLFSLNKSELNNIASIWWTQYGPDQFEGDWHFGFE